MVRMEERPSDQRPVVIAIGGFLCGGGDVSGRKYSFWGAPTAALEAQGFRVVTVSPSPVGSLHDRACQVFYELKGGTVCYGQEHSRAHDHACHGETYDSGLFSAWGEDYPVHLIGHSFGGQTARVLQHLMATGFFSEPGGYQTSAAWVRSVTACNAPLNGSLLVYSLGEKADTAPAVRVGSHGHLLSVAIHVVELLDWAFLRRIFDPRLSHFQLSWHHLGWHRACAEFARALVGDSVIFARPDNAAFDMTVHSAHRWNQEIRTDPHTFFFSMMGTRPDPPTKQEVLATLTGDGRTGWVSSIWTRLVIESMGLNGLLTRLIYSALRWLHAWQEGGHMRAVESRFGLAVESWSSAGNDGVLGAFTQSHPRVPEECETPVSFGLPESPSALKPGVWHVVPVFADHMWTHVGETYAREAFERLALCLRRVADGDPTAANPASGLLASHRAGVRRSPRLLAKARRLQIATAAAPVYRSEYGEECAAGGAACGNAPASPPGKGLDGSRIGARCDACLAGGVDSRERDINSSGGTVSDGEVSLHGGLRCRRGLRSWSFLVVALMLTGVLLLLSFWLVGTPPPNTDYCDGRRVAHDKVFFSAETARP
ncbi:unnamed protein product [Pylaiella littoralis]